MLIAIFQAEKCFIQGKFEEKLELVVPNLDRKGESAYTRTKKKLT